MQEDFVGAVGLNRTARFAIDPHDERSDEEFYELIGDDNGVFGWQQALMEFIYTLAMKQPKAQKKDISI